MLMPSIFNDNLFDNFFDFPFYDDRAERQAEKKLYGHHAANLMKTDIKVIYITFPYSIIPYKIPEGLPLRYFSYIYSIFSIR